MVSKQTAEQLYEADRQERIRTQIKEVLPKAERGNSFYQHILALLYFEVDNEDESLRWLKVCAYENVAAMTSLAYYIGNQMESEEQLFWRGELKRVYESD